MKLLICTFAGLSIAAAATAQPTTGSARQNAPVAQGSWLPGPMPERLECLREKASGQRICKTRDQWERIAARIDAGKTWRN